MTSDKLLPCPGCGCQDTVVVPLDDGDNWWVECLGDNCSFTGPERTSKSEAIAVWNKLSNAIHTKVQP